MILHLGNYITKSIEYANYYFFFKLQNNTHQNQFFAGDWLFIACYCSIVELCHCECNEAIQFLQQWIATPKRLAMTGFSTVAQ